MEELSNRDKYRGTGRTTRSLGTAIEHGRAHGMFKAGNFKMAFFVINNMREWDHLKIIARQFNPVKIETAQRRIHFADPVQPLADPVIIQVVSADTQRIDGMRGYRCPVVIDHNVYEISNIEFRDMLEFCCGDRIVPCHEPYMVQR